MSDLVKLKKIISSIGPDSCPYAINFHCHTLCSDGSLSPVQLIKQATTLNVGHISVTDHHSISAYVEMNVWLNQNKSEFKKLPTLWTGIEISCLLRNCIVHVIGLGFDLTHQSLQPYTRGEAPIGQHLRAESVVSSLHEAGGLVVLAHPARYRLPYTELIEEAARLGFDAGEAWYNYEHSSIWHPSDYICKSINHKLKSLGLLSTCGTDTHGLQITCR